MSGGKCSAFVGQRLAEKFIELPMRHRATDEAGPLSIPRLVYCVYMHCVIRLELLPTASIPKAINL